MNTSEKIDVSDSKHLKNARDSNQTKSTGCVPPPSQKTKLMIPRATGTRRNNASQTKGLSCFAPRKSSSRIAIRQLNAEGEGNITAVHQPKLNARPGSQEVQPGTIKFKTERRSTVSARGAVQMGASSTKQHIEKSIVESSDSAVSEQTVDYDALYCTDGEDDEDMDAHGSVITHLLQQVKIGMDLTKVALPTFILERRSLLEMYADYFAHPDIFVKITDFQEPRDRMVQVVLWYLSSFHAGRNSSVAKKPYNPVLGEIFRCYWDVPGIISNNKIRMVENGPLPWCNTEQLTFVAEQVSHHPPISAFYAEHVSKRISFNAHIYTKSKFLGLSICVYNIGRGVVTVMDYNEEYIVTFPNGYGRSILTVPWIELGGSVTISCENSGYHCDIEFLTKPFYGSKKHRITAEVFAPSEKKPFLAIQGEWNGLMEARWADKPDTEVFVDVRSLNVVPKRVRPISQQQPNESRLLWKEVTYGLKYKDIEKATRAKALIEQQQREQMKERQERNHKWETKFFKLHGDNWQYIKPLQQRPSSEGEHPAKIHNKRSKKHSVLSQHSN